MRRAHALLLVGIGCWDAWRLLAMRIDDPAAALLLLLAAAGTWWAGRDEPERAVPARLVASLLLAYALAAIIGPPLLRIGIAAASLAVLASQGARRRGGRLPLVGAALLCLPIMPTLDFLLAYPLRRLSAMLAAGLLHLNGMSVGLEGVALEWHGRILLFDGPCSGVRMLWASLLLASLLGWTGAFGPLRYASTLVLAVVAAVIGNALRAASLFYLENGLVAPLGGAWAHEAVGIVAFLLVAAATIAAARPAWRPA